MKRLQLMTLTALVLASSGAAAGTIDDLFQAGVRDFSQAATPSDYARAADSFRALHETWHVNAPEVLLNLGASEFLAGDTDPGGAEQTSAGPDDRTGEAMLFLHRTVKAAPDSLAAGLATKNLEKIRHRLNEKHSTTGRTGYVFAPYNDGWTALFSWLAPDIAWAVFLSAWCLLFLLIAARRLISGRIAVILPAAFAAIAAISLVGAVGASLVEGYTTGVILEPAPIFGELLAIESDDELPEGLEFRLMEKKDQRLRIRLSSGQSGWVHDDKVGIP